LVNNINFHYQRGKWQHVFLPGVILMTSHKCIIHFEPTWREFPHTGNKGLKTNRDENMLCLVVVLCSFSPVKNHAPRNMSLETRALMSQPHFEGSVRSPLTLPKMGLESPSGLPKIQSSIARVKTPHIEVFFIPLERFWSVDVQNGLAWAIWTSPAQVMVERKAGSQTGSLTPDH
jgi:hypothetical protein